MNSDNDHENSVQKQDDGNFSVAIKTLASEQL
jgi:hypothetical protein